MAIQLILLFKSLFICLENTNNLREEKNVIHYKALHHIQIDNFLFRYRLS